MNTFILIVACLIIYEIIKPKAIKFFYKYISGRKIYWDKELKILYYFDPFFPEMMWKCQSGISKPIFKLNKDKY